MPASPDVLTVEPIHRASGAVDLPGSKSIYNRVLLLSALANGETTLNNLLDADDTQVMRTALSQLGIAFDHLGTDVQTIGCDGKFPIRAARLELGNAGTAFRSLTAAPPSGSSGRNRARH